MNGDIYIKLDEGAREIIGLLEKNGYEAYAVGGCVRDSVLGKTPFDWDITTSALPEKTKEIFSDYTVIPTGLKHGTVTVVISGNNYEITTFRKESGYKDGRHPEEIEFVSSLKEDLSRRDFTINALAYNEKVGIIDLYEGLSDLKSGVIRTVGNPFERFEEDYLRILRAVRFSSTLGFEIEENTYRACEKYADKLKNISKERIFAEFTKLITGKNVLETLMSYPEIIFEVIPEIKPCYKFKQHSKWHKYDVYEHISRAVANISPDETLRFAMLFHDICKPECFFIGDDGAGHFYGHAEKSAPVVREVLKRLKAPNKLINDVYTLVLRHDRQLKKGDVGLKLLLRDLGEDLARKLLKVKLADNMAQEGYLNAECIEKSISDQKRLDELLSSGVAYRISDLKISGNDIENMGFKGEEIGKTLAFLLDEVIYGNIENEREILLKVSEKRYNKLKK